VQSVERKRKEGGVGVGTEPLDRGLNERRQNRRHYGRKRREADLLAYITHATSEE